MKRIKGANRKLGELLIREEVITRQQLEDALQEKQSGNEFLGEVLVRSNYITEDELIGFLVRQCRIPHLKLSNFQVSSEVSELIPPEICNEHKLLPIDKLGTLLTVAMVNPIDVEALEKVKNNVKLRIKPILCSLADFRNLYDKIYSSEESKIRQSQEGLSAAGEEVEKPLEQAQAQTVAPAVPKKADSKEERATDEQRVPNEDGLIERLTFDNFVVAEANSFTYALARSVGEAPGSEYNPLFIYGNTGLGKTHLSNAIGNEIVRHNRDMGVVYAAASRFIDEMLHAIEHEQMKKFRDHYGSVDVLILDDVQFLSGRTRAQQEFFNIFNVLHGKKKQIVFVSDVPPKKLEGLEKRLISRFEGGVVACLEAPDFQTRVTILRQRTEAAAAEVPDDVLESLAESIRSNVRELEGALKKLLAYSSLVGHEITVELAQEILKHLFKAEDKPA